MTDPMTERKAKLKAIADAHDEWVAEKDSAGEIPDPSEYETEFSDANQFAADGLLPQEDFLSKVDEKTAPAMDPLAKAVEGLEAVISVLKARDLG